MIRILLDQCIPRSAASILLNMGWDVVHTGEIGLSCARDAYILEYATNFKTLYSPQRRKVRRVCLNAFWLRGPKRNNWPVI